MSYQVLARKLRPRDFAGLVGQEPVVRALCNGLDSGRVHHAYLFTGTRGVGKTSIARILAKSLNCEGGVSSKPCGKCSICREIQENRFVDLLEVDAASRTRVDDTRELLDNAQYMPSRGRCKVYLIDEVHMLSASSFNALLKTLEEPPPHVKFLLATTDPKKVPVTVLSRCLQFQLRNISREEIARYLDGALTEEGLKFEAEALDIIAKAARGSMRDALSIADQAIAHGQGMLRALDVAAMLGLTGRDETAAVVDALVSGSASRVLEVSEALADKSVDFGAALADLLEALHAMAVNQALRREADNPLAPEAVQLYYQIALLGYRDLHFGPDPKTCFEMTLLRMLAFAPDAQAAARVPRAEVAAKVPRAEATAKALRAEAGARASQAEAGAGASQAEAGAGASQAEAGAKAHRAEAGAAAKGRAADLAASPSVLSGAPEAAAAAPAGDSKAPEFGGAALHEAGGEGAPWHEIVEQLPLDGIGRAIAEHCLPLAPDAGRFRLMLDREQEALLDEGQLAAVEGALRTRFGQGLRLDIAVGDLAGETPARRKARLAAERQAQAERQLREDGVVQSLIAAFDARLVDVRPALAPPREDSAPAPSGLPGALG